MKTLSFRLLSIGAVTVFLFSCSGNNDANQQQVTVPPVQPAAPVETVVVQAQPSAQAAPAANAQALPEAVNAFVKQYFPNATIAGVEMDSDHGGVEYDVHLSDGTEIDFDVNNQWDNVDCHTKAVPASLVPKAIAAYVSSNYQNMAITKINKEYHGYEIELANGLDLNFDRSGNFMGMDD